MHGKCVSQGVLRLWMSKVISYNINVLEPSEGIY